MNKHDIQGPGAYYADDEISLIDLAKILVRRKVWFLTTFSITLLGFLSYAAKLALMPAPTEPPKITYTTLIAVGLQAPSSLIEPLESIKTLVQKGYIPQLKATHPEFSDLSVETVIERAPNHIFQMITKAQDSQRTTVTEFHGQIAKLILERHEFLMNQYQTIASQSTNGNISPVSIPSDLSVLAIPSLIQGNDVDSTSKKKVTLLVFFGFIGGLTLGALATFTKEFVVNLRASLKEENI